MEKSDATIRKRIETRLKHLAENHVPPDAKFIRRDEGEKVFRYRIGDYRALYKIKEKQKLVLVTKIDKRPRVYQ